MTQALRIRAVMLDWAGTTVDHGSIAPVLALTTLFAKHGIVLSMQDARRDMGLLKGLLVHTHQEIAFHIDVLHFYFIHADKVDLFA